MASSHGLTGSRRFVASRRYDYVGIDEYIGTHEVRTVWSGIKPQWHGRRTADHMNEAYSLGASDLAKDLAAFVDSDAMLSRKRLTRVLAAFLENNDTASFDLASAIAAIDAEDMEGTTRNA